MSRGLRIEVVHLAAAGIESAWLRLPAGATVADALREAGRAAPSGGFSLDAGKKVAIFGRLVGSDQRLMEGDRVELHSRLAVDPKLARRARAGAQRGSRPPVRQ